MDCVKVFVCVCVCLNFGPKSAGFCLATQVALLLPASVAGDLTGDFRKRFQGLETSVRCCQG